MMESLSQRIRPYSSSVRIKRAEGFSSLREVHHDLAWVTESHLRHGSFRTSSDFSDWEGSAYSDFQIQPGAPVFHLGSARSIHFGDHYLKGVGLTPMFPVRNSDYYHGSGHLLASSAAREYLVSVWVKQLGLGKSIIPCDGLLVAEMHASLAEVARKTYASGGNFDFNLMPPCDRTLQAISVKPSGFLRFTNFSWLLRSGADVSLDALTRVIRDWGTSLDADFTKSEDGINEEIGTIFGQIESQTVLGLEEFFRFQTSGILWCSLNNNFSAGIKFLDLEVPLVTGPDLIYDFSNREDREFDCPAHFEVFQAVKQVREWILDLLGWCRARELYYGYLKNPAHAPYHELLRIISSEIETRLVRESRIFNDSHWVGLIRNHYGSRIGDHAQAGLAEVIDQQRSLRLTGSIKLSGPYQSDIVTQARYGLELGKSPSLIAPSWFPRERFLADIDSGWHRLFAECIKAVEKETTPEGFLTALSYAELQIETTFANK